MGLGLTSRELLGLYRTMLRIRLFEEALESLIHRMVLPGFFHLSIGQEAVAAGVCLALRREDYVVSTHRCHGHCIAKGAPLRSVMAELLGRRDGCCRGKGGSMHLSCMEVGFVGGNGIVGANVPIATGIAYAIKYLGLGRVVVSFFGDGAVNTGAFHEGMNMASLWRLPAVFVCENNEYAISTHVSRSTSVREIAVRARAYDMPGVVVDGMNAVDVYRAAREAVERARGGGGPTLIEARGCRMVGSYVGDVQEYRPREEVEECRKRDPIPRMEELLVSEGVIDKEGLKRIREEVEGEVRDAVDYALKSPFPRPEEALSNFMPEPPDLPYVNSPEEVGGDVREMSYREALNYTLREEMGRDPRIFLVGEDIGYHGGDFGVTKGLIHEFGEWRVRDTPISESGIIGVALGSSMLGLKPIAEIMFMDFIGVCMDQLMNQVAKLRYMYGGQVRTSLIVRTAYGAGIQAAAQHSQSLEALFTHIPGFRVVMPSTPFDARGLLKTAIRDENPVIFLEHKLLYDVKGPVPLTDYYVPLGKAAVRREGEDVTVVATGLMVYKALKVAERLKEEGVSVEVIDPRTLNPLDREAIVASAEKTGRLVIVQEAWPKCSFASEVIAIVAEELGGRLKGVARVTSLEVPTPFSPPMEEYVLPSEGRITVAVKELTRS